jgi:hypothetical protein
VAPKSSDDPNGQLVCTFYQDLMIRESGTDTPAPNAAVVLPLPAAQARPACDATHRNNEVALKTEGFSFVGRKGLFLLFSATDPNGAVPFMVIDAGSSRVVFEDATPADRGLQAIAVEHGNLHLHYKHAFNAPCSIMQNATACWSQLIAAGKLPHSMEQACHRHSRAPHPTRPLKRRPLIQASSPMTSKRLSTRLVRRRSRRADR